MYQRWKTGRLPIEDYRGITRVRRGAVMKAVAQIELELDKDVKNFKSSPDTLIASRNRLQAHC